MRVDMVLTKLTPASYCRSTGIHYTLCQSQFQYMMLYLHDKLLRFCLLTAQSNHRRLMPEPISCEFFKDMFQNTLAPASLRPEILFFGDKKTVAKLSRWLRLRRRLRKLE